MDISIQRFFARFVGYELTVKKPTLTVTGVYDPSRRDRGRVHPFGRFGLTLVTKDGSVVYGLVPVDITGVEMDDPITIEFLDGTKIIARKP